MLGAAFRGGRWVALLTLCMSVAMWGCEGTTDGETTDAEVTPDMQVTTQCTNGEDDDGDGAIDGADPGCSGAADDDESDDPGPPQCSNGEDDDGDGATDFPNDPGCADGTDDDESDDPPPPQCRNGEDDDGDGATDFPDDPGCGSPLDNDESDDPELPACGNGIDDDMDGFIDFPADPGCGSEFDDDEVDDDGPVLPQCANAVDDDMDGLIDLADPGCSSVADPRETDPEEAPACTNGLDDDADGLTDFPTDPGCSAAGDEDEADPNIPPQCGNGEDDDGDGEADYPNDPGCAGVGDRDETDPPILPACADGADNDNDGDIDFPEDGGCSSAADGAEGGACGRTYTAVEVDANQVLRGDSGSGSYDGEGSCGGRGAPVVVFVHRVSAPIEALVVRTDFPGNEVETAIYIRRGCLDAQSEVACSREPTNDGVAANRVELESPPLGEYYIFLDGAAGRGGNFEMIIEEVPLAACLNGLDDDEDGLIDYPVDPGCERASDRDETDPPEFPACFDDVDNDGDGEVDYPLDAGCTSAADDDEVDLCGQGLRIDTYPAGAPFVITDTAEGSTEFAPGCGPGDGPERIFLYENPFNANLTFTVNFPETIARTTVYVRSSCVDAGSEAACDAGEAPDSKGVATFERAPPGLYYVFVDHPFGLGGQVKLGVEVERLPAGCSDAFDNDEDGFIDGDDIGCSGPDDEDEADPPLDEPPVCFNGLDDDDDGWIDYPFDPGCPAKGDDDEADPEVPPVCSNGVDDDEDGIADFPGDRGCNSAADEDEVNDRRAPRCSNRIDDDQDGLLDYPQDPGCAALGDLSEVDDPVPPPCFDGLDNDRDGLVDFPYDPGCIAAGHGTEVEGDVLPVCANGEDDDEDGITDFPLEPGCIFAADDSEDDPAFPPQCANGNDDDQNGRTDFPDDPGCRFAGDTSERADGPVLARCADGVDNDFDGATDLADIGCLNSRDNDEADPEVAPFCADEIDNDEDGLVDWPDEDGCEALGDVCEQFGFALCENVCQDVQANPLQCGRCGRVCAPGIECIAGRCGVIRPNVHQCSTNQGRERPVAEYIRGELARGGARGVSSCEFDDTVQAVLVTPTGYNQLNGNGPALRNYLEGGGQLITSNNTSWQLYNLIFGANVVRGQRGGSCAANIQPTVQFGAGDQFWGDNLFQAIGAAASGCGYSINNIPGVTVLGGWDPQNAFLGYLDVGAGRLWFADVNWYDQRNEFTDASRDLMASMILGSGNGPPPPCQNGRDDDEDGFVDLDDSGCFGVDDPAEDDPEVEPACANGEDDDGDGVIDFPFELGCVAAGDDDETDPEDLPACGNGLDDDGDGEPDFPFDRGCAGAGDLDELDPVRNPTCGNNNDDDGDGLTDYPADPGCESAVDPDEEDPPVVPGCSNGIDDDRDGITDFPFDVGCADARDDDETDPDVLPDCFNRLDDDEDGELDFPADPGCQWAADPRETDVGDGPTCGNGADDDGDGLTDWPEDRGCRFAGDSSEVDPFRPIPRCVDGVDNDSDGAIDLSDIGCVNREDDDELDPADAPLCGNEIDDDEDGLFDWPADPGCQALGDNGEDQSCGAELEVQAFGPDGVAVGGTEEDGPDLFRNRCGGREAPDVVYRYTLDEPVDVLRFSAENEGTDYPVVISVRRDCLEPLSQLACAGDFQNPTPTVDVRNAEPGEYYVIVDGGGPERWVSNGDGINMPNDPNNFVARDDFRANCGWSDGGNDAFDCYGRIVVAHGGAQTGELDPTLGGPRAGNVGGYGFTYQSELVNNVWRFTLRPAVENDERLVNITITGNLGSDGGTVAQQGTVPFQGRDIRWLFTTDGGRFDPPVFHMLVPGDPEQLENVVYANNRDNVTITANNLALPATFYVALSFAAGANNPGIVANAIVDDLEVQAGGGGPDAPRFGEYVLTVERDPADEPADLPE